MPQCIVCGMSIPDGHDDCVNCARPEKDRIVSMKGDFVPPKPRKTKKKDT